MKRLFIILVSVALVGGILYLSGLRVTFAGGGRPRLAFVSTPDAQAKEIERHRAAQRASLGTEAAPAMPAPATSVSPGSAQSPGDVPIVAGGTASPSTAMTGLAPYWTDFRGPARDGHYREMPVRVSWPASGLTPLWKEPVGAGYASVVAARGRAFTIEQRRGDEVVAAYDIVTGRELWTTRWPGEFRESMGGDGPRATPTWHDGFVYALGALGELRCLDETSGRMVWRKNILEDNGAENLQWGMAASPLVADDAVIVLPGGGNGRSVVAYDRRTGTRMWSALSERQAYASPMLVTLAGVRQLLVVSASRLMGLTIDRGDVLWSYPWVTDFDINAAQPIVIGENRVFISSGYGVGGAVIELSRQVDGTFGVREVWRNIRMKNRFASSVLLDGSIYGLDEAILTCIDADTGSVRWKGGRYGYGQVILASGQLIILTEDGELALVSAKPDRYEELARFQVLRGKTWNHPALAGGILIVRNLQEMAAFDLR